MRARFNPLHCGAVVASTLRLRARHVTLILVSIPFIAGQWSLPHPAEGGMGESRGFQSPSLRGSGRFRQAGPPPRRVSIPFIAGQWSLPPRRMAGGGGLRGVSIPFIAGQWSLLVWTAADAPPPRPVSIPFIAGQWSLPPIPPYGGMGDARFQSPSLRGSGRFRHQPRSYEQFDLFQSPSLRGSGRFNRRALDRVSFAVGFQSPSLRGSGRFLKKGSWAQKSAQVSIPFIAGQWSLPFVFSYQVLLCRFCFNPLHCGAVVASL